jgi:hypothetical protein
MPILQNSTGVFAKLWPNVYLIGALSGKNVSQLTLCPEPIQIFVSGLPRTGMARGRSASGAGDNAAALERGRCG